MSIDRPDIECSREHVYTLDSERVPGASTISKVCADPDPLIGWAFNETVEGCWTLYHEDAESGLHHRSIEGFKGELFERKLTPYHRRSRAAVRGNVIHGALEALAQEDRVPEPEEFEATSEEAGHLRALIRWYVEWNPEWEATEVVVGSRTHRYAGRYDIRAWVPLDKLCELLEEYGLPYVEVGSVKPMGGRPWALVLIDLKTSKRVYPTEHFAQLSLYETASVEMGFKPTVAQLVLNTHPDGSYDFVPSRATERTGLLWLECYREKERLDPPPPPCEAKTAKGKPCTNRAKPGRKKCGVHERRKVS